MCLQWFLSVFQGRRVFEYTTLQHPCNALLAYLYFGRPVEAPAFNAIIEGEKRMILQSVGLQLIKLEALQNQ